jgi:hypothetical protein
VVGQGRPRNVELIGRVWNTKLRLIGRLRVVTESDGHVGRRSSIISLMVGDEFDVLTSSTPVELAAHGYTKNLQGFLKSTWSLCSTNFTHHFKFICVIACAMVNFTRCYFKCIPVYRPPYGSCIWNCPPVTAVLRSVHAVLMVYGRQP